MGCGASTVYMYGPATALQRLPVLVAAPHVATLKARLVAKRFVTLCDRILAPDELAQVGDIPWTKNQSLVSLLVVERLDAFQIWPSVTAALPPEVTQFVLAFLSEHGARRIIDRFCKASFPDQWTCALLKPDTVGMWEVYISLNMQIKTLAESGVFRLRFLFF
jgi:hypothetical protein